MSKRILFSLLVCLLVLFVLYPKSKTSEIYLPVKEKTATEDSDKNFHLMMDVLTHKRCVNCHPNDNIPKQGEDSHPHYFGMSRGENNLGFDATKCTTCHQSENNDYSGVPGAPEWSLAPASMKWEGLDRYEIAALMLDPKRNGGRTPDETMHHLTEHELVLWAWNPGVNANGDPREKPPVSKEKYIKAVKQWFEDGAVIPENPNKK
ncbi:hypothetical protein [uncultured Tenacibaculum sp.]|uniref:hypothetical protein n=1 Tax=uncultured Tenacibaculum sp. TaxID=174713 RepID=UPI00262F8B14|nr:hypothetical protein [uncultured Tenacibaculum sp.]